MNNFVEFYCGSGTMANTFKMNGYNTFTVDNRMRKGVCMPDLKKDMNLLNVKDIPFKRVKIAWFGQPCTPFSYAPGTFYFKDGQFTAAAKPFLKLVDKTMQLLEDLNPDIFFIENPRGRIIEYEPFKQFILQKKLFIHTITLGSYGFHTQKPTYIISNKPWLFPFTNQKFGRGAKSAIDFDTLTTCQRQKYPALFCETILQLIKTQNL